jgi:hypothetical protein
MKNSLEARRQKLVRELGKLGRAIEAEQKSLKQIEARLAVLSQDRAKAA